MRTTWASGGPPSRPGRYARTLVRDWESRIPELPAIVGRMRSALPDAGLDVDPTRPMLEYYRRQDELLIMVPVRSNDGQG